jgi:hypothetical protein
VAIAVLISGFAYAAWTGRRIIVTNRRVIYHAALSKSVSAVPLDKIEQVKQEPGKVVVHTGTALNTLTLSVPDAEALAAAIEAARANALIAPHPAAPTPATATGKKKKQPSRSELIGGWTVLGVIGLGTLLYNLPEPAVERSVFDRYPAAPTPTPAVPPATAGPDLSISPVATRVSDTINTSALMDCWMTAIRAAPDWMYDGSRRGDTLARLYGKGGIAVTVAVVGNRIDTQRLELAGVIGSDGQAIRPDTFGQAGRLGYWEAQDIYTSAVRAIRRCGIAEVPLPNGVFHFIFDPNRDDIPVVRMEN